MKLKIIILLLTVLLQVLLEYELKLLDNPKTIFLIFIVCLLAGLVVRSSSGSMPVRSLGWALVASSIIAVVMMVLFIVWLALISRDRVILIYQSP